jgi:hypothetical protein
MNAPRAARATPSEDFAVTAVEHVCFERNSESRHEDIIVCTYNPFSSDS